MNNILNNVTVVITTFLSGENLEKCLQNIPKYFQKLIIDNANEKNKKDYFEKKFENLTYYLSSENLGVPRSYSLANKLVKTKYMFNTQPDVIIKKNCIENLMKKLSTYKNAIILSPTIFHNGNYHVDGDFKILKIRNSKFYNVKNFFFNSVHKEPPHGDFSVEAVTGTAMLIDRDKLMTINDWDKNIFNYFEDMDLCLRSRLKGYEIIKIRDAEVDHDAFSSHTREFENELDFSRNWHYSWSRVYFKKKHESYINAIYWGFWQCIKSTTKYFIYFLINKKKSTIHYAKLSGYLNAILNRQSSFRPKIKI